MFYTLLKFLWWGVLLALIGGWVGWSLRGVGSRLGSGIDSPADQGEVGRLRQRLAELDGVVEERNRLLMRIADDRRALPGEVPEIDDVDLRDDEITIGRRRRDLRPNDLTAIKGIGPKIAELCAGIGIETWRDLADTDVDALNDMLEAAGTRFQVHDPSEWPRQARLLADGDLDGFRDLVEELDAER